MYNMIGIVVSQQQKYIKLVCEYLLLKSLVACSYPLIYLKYLYAHLSADKSGPKTRTKYNKYQNIIVAVKCTQQTHHFNQTQTALQSSGVMLFTASSKSSEGSLRPPAGCSAMKAHPRSGVSNS